MIIRKYDNYFLIKVFKDNLDEFNIFDVDSVKGFFQSIFEKLCKKYDFHGLIDVDVFVNQDYGMIIELKPIDSYFDEIDMRIRIHLNNDFLVKIDSNSILDYDEVYYYNGEFYGNYIATSDNEVFYKDTDAIVSNGIKIY